MISLIQIKESFNILGILLLCILCFSTAPAQANSGEIIDRDLMQEDVMEPVQKIPPTDIPQAFENTYSIKELERISINIFHTHEVALNVKGCQIINGEFSKLPIGSTLDKKKGIFYWQPGVGFIGDYEFLFKSRKLGTGRKIKISINPKFGHFNKLEIKKEKSRESSSSRPFGSFDTPIDGSTVASSIPVTGWALDDSGIASVKIYRGKGENLVYIGDATFVEGARPDVAAAYPGYPNNTKAGWGYLMLTNFLPNGGNGTFTFHAIATDIEGEQVTLGTKTVIIDNTNAVKPFGALDTPTQGGTASGSDFINWGWVLTPQPNRIPTDGSTINVYVDGINLGHPTYNIYRSDIANLFPDYANSEGAVGYFYLDTCAYENGVHTIQWTATDSGGNSDGIGSRYFSINNQENMKIEIENYDDYLGQIRVEEQSHASNGKCVHFGPDSNIESEGVGDVLIFNFSIDCVFPKGVFEIRYTDDVGGNIIHIYLDGKKKGCFMTYTTGGWNNFQFSQIVTLGTLSKGTHTIKLEMTRGGSWGVLLDYFEITKQEQLVDEIKGAYNYVKSLISENTGLVRSAHYDKSFTTLYKNALAAVVFIHENELGLAEVIFDFFKSKYNKNSFTGFNQNWNPDTGEGSGDHWEGDNAFLLIALNYYKEKTASFGKYEEMAEGLMEWLCERADEDIIAEGLADMYAALKPFENSVPGMDNVLLQLENGFYEKVDYQNVLDHIERGALCFSDISGFFYIDIFKRIETWEYNDEEINALAAFSWENFVNIEISAQILLAWKLFKSELSIDLSYLQTELNKLWLFDYSISQYGLPYFLSYDPTPQTGHGWIGCYYEPIIDPTCYMLFYYWDFNPMDTRQSK
jgi:hypothetical protein